jgi:hypothetical protein
MTGVIIDTSGGHHKPRGYQDIEGEDNDSSGGDAGDKVAGDLGCGASSDSSNGTVDIERVLLAERIHSELKGAFPLEQLQDLASSGLLQQIPRGQSGELASVGSLNHGAGECTPCAYWFKGMCKKSLLCNYCHFPHTGQKNKRLRPSKHTRMRIRRGEEKGDASREDTEREWLLELPPQTVFDSSLEGTITHL